MIEVELIYDSDCRKVYDTRRNLAQALARAGLERRWTEWNRSASRAPERTRRFGSPTVVINRDDVGALRPVAVPVAGCTTLRIGGGVPPVDLIVAALNKTKTRRERMALDLKPESKV